MAMTPPFVVRPMRPEDAAAIRDLVAQLGPWLNTEGRAQIARDLGSHGGFVAVQESRLLGFVAWTRVDAQTVDLSWMGVDPDLHGRGIGTALLMALVAELRSEGFRFLEVSTVADNVDYEPYERTRRFYRARGFADLRVDARYWGAGEDRYDRLVLRRDLTAEGGYKGRH